MLDLGLGITNLVKRTTAAATALSDDEYRDGSVKLAAKVRRYKPRVVAFLGIGSYRVGFSRPKASLGLQPEQLGGSSLWVLPSPSGLNANHQLADLVALFSELREWVDQG